MPLRLTNSTEIAVLNRWAARVEQQQTRLAEELKRFRRSGVGTSETGGDGGGTTTPPSPVDNGPLLPPTNVQISENGTIVNGTTYSQLTCTYSAPSTTTAVAGVLSVGSFAGVWLAVLGYNGSTDLQKIAEHRYSGPAGGPASFEVLLTPTDETITCYFVPFNHLNQAPEIDWHTCPHVEVTLNATMSAPTGPQGFTGKPTDSGAMLSWFANPEPNLKGYNIYRNTAYQVGTATLLTTVTPDQLHYTDPAALIRTYVYWLSAINTADMESGLIGPVSSIGFLDNWTVNVQNDSWEDDTVFWSMNADASVIPDATKAQIGTRYLQLTTSSNTRVYQTDIFGDIKLLSVAPGQSLYYGVNMLRETGDGIPHAGVTFYNASRQILSEQVQAPASYPAGWTFAAGSITVPAGAAFVNFFVEVDDATTSTVVRFDYGRMYVQGTSGGSTATYETLITQQISVDTTTWVVLGTHTITIAPATYAITFKLTSQTDGSSFDEAGPAISRVRLGAAVYSGTPPATPQDTNGTISDPVGDHVALYGGVDQTPYAGPTMATANLLYLPPA